MSYSKQAIFTLFWAITLTLLPAGCISNQKKNEINYPDLTKISAPLGYVGTSTEEILNKINNRNTTVEDDQKWIAKSYSGLMIRRLDNVSEKEYQTYAEYLDNGTVYIIVHPSYYPFFDELKPLLANNEDGPYSKENVVEKLLSLKPRKEKLYILQAQEKRMKDFIEFKSTEGKLVILVIPKNYYKYKGYAYRKGTDEYMRYLNEITNFSKSILFVESKSPNRGYITEENSIRLMEFLLNIKAKRILIGGGYIGRCLEDFYKYITEDYGSEGIYIVPELSDISPRELTEFIASKVIKPDGTLDTEVLTQFMKQDIYRRQEVIPQIINLPIKNQKAE